MPEVQPGPGKAITDNRAESGALYCKSAYGLMRIYAVNGNTFTAHTMK